MSKMALRGMVTKRKTRVGIIGVGGIARGAHIPGYQKLPDVELVAFCDIIPERAKQGVEEFGAPGAKAYEDYRELLARDDIDAVSVCTPNAVHAEITIAALDAGKHVICEKPMAIRPEEAWAMVEAAKRNDRILTIGYQSRFGDDAQLLKSMIEDGVLGEVYYARALALRRRGVPTWGVFLDKDKQGGGPLIDIGTHALDLTLWLMGPGIGRPVWALGATFRKLADRPGYNLWGPWDPAKFQVEDSGFGLITFESGAVVSVETSWALNIRESPFGTIIAGTRAGAELVDGQLRVNTDERGRLVDQTFNPGRSDSLHHREIAHFVECVREGKEPLVKPEEAAVVVQILDAIYRSAEARRPVEVWGKTPAQA